MLLLNLSLLLAVVQAVDPRHVLTPVSEWRKKMERNALAERDINPLKLYKDYYLKVPIDHFHNDSMYAPHSNEMFSLRYFMDDTYYQPGGPVIMLLGGETYAEERLPYMQKGILAQLANATGGMSIILEHRYYGKSFPTPDLSTENLRFLTTDQAMADTAYFAQHVKFPGYENEKLNSPHTAWISYGGSYAGAFSAILRKAYPDVIYGAISSSGVVEAIYDYWKYYEAARLYAPQTAVKTQQDIIQLVDNILLNSRNKGLIPQLKSVFLLPHVTRNDDFANVLSFGIAGLQNTNWDPAINYPDWEYYLGNISSNTVLWPATERSRASVELLMKASHFNSTSSTFVNRVLNFIGWNNYTQIASCKGSQDSCFSTYNTTFYHQTSLSTQVWRSWAYQYCTQWGFLQTGSGVPSNIRPVISRAVTLHYTSEVCRAAFDIHKPSDVQIINKWGGYNISYPRLAIIDGISDPWRDACPHATGTPPRKSTTSEPYILIEGGAVHHWDENGLFPNETTADLPPKPVADTQAQEATFVKAWLADFKPGSGTGGKKSSGKPSSTSGSGPKSTTKSGKGNSSNTGSPANAIVYSGSALPATIVATLTALALTSGATLPFVRQRLLL